MTRVVAVLVVATALPCAAQPRLTDARFAERAVAGTLAATVRQIVDTTAAPAWIAWAAPVADPDSTMCCFYGDWHQGAAEPGTCRLDPGTGGAVLRRDDRTGATRLEAADVFFVFLRVENRAVERVRMFSENCVIDAGQQTVTWLTEVRPAESVGLLAALAEAESTERVTKGAVTALAQHGVAEAIPPLLRLARSAPAAKVRGDALFWIAQRAGTRAAAAITDAIANDPETAVKKRAVFALTQLPDNAGVPKLIEVARNNRNPAVRKQAMFWLGQSKDPRAIAFFEEVLLK